MLNQITLLPKFYNGKFINGEYHNHTEIVIVPKMIVFFDEE